MIEYLNNTIFIKWLKTINLTLGLLAIIGFLLMFSCSEKHEDAIYTESNSNLIGLGSFFQMKGKVDTLLIEDYFLGHR